MLLYYQKIPQLFITWQPLFLLLQLRRTEGVTSAPDLVLDWLPKVCSQQDAYRIAYQVVVEVDSNPPSAGDVTALNAADTSDVLDTSANPLVKTGSQLFSIYHCLSNGWNGKWLHYRLSSYKYNLFINLFSNKSSLLILFRSFVSNHQRIYSSAERFECLCLEILCHFQTRQMWCDVVWWDVVYIRNDTCRKPEQNQEVVPFFKWILI
jgi:hypothetical protein